MIWTMLIPAAHHSAFANAVAWLDKHQGAVTAALTAVLVLITGYYAWQNRRMVGEMRRARLAVLVPKLALEFHYLGPMTATVAIQNVGPGAALDIDVRLIYEPVQAGQEAPERRWRRNVLASGEQFDFLDPAGIQNNIGALSSKYKAIRLVGTMKDAIGSKHTVEESFEDLAEWWEVLQQAHARWAASDPERRLADALANKFDSRIKNVTGAIDRVAATIDELRTANGKVRRVSLIKRLVGRRAGLTGSRSD